MKISYNWIKQFLQTDWDATKTGELLTDLGLEVEGIEKKESIKGSLKGIVVGEVLTCIQHPNADRLKVTTVDLGKWRSSTNCMRCSQCSSRSKSSRSYHWNPIV